MAGNQVVNRTWQQANTPGFRATPGAYSQQQRMIMEAFRAEEYIKDQMDVQSEPLYDTLSQVLGDVITPGQPSTSFFSVVAGKDVNLTNMVQPNQLMNPEAQAVMAYRYFIDPRNAVNDCEGVMANLALVFTMGRKAYQTIPLWEIPQGGGIDVQGGDCCDCVVHNGRPEKQAIRTLGVTLILEQGVRFEGELQGTSYTVTGDTYIHQLNLDGLHARGIQ